MTSKNESEYTTPLVLRYGILVDLKKTLAFVFTWMIFLILLFCASGVSIWTLVYDVWFWTWLVLWPPIAMVTRSIVTGCENLFNIFDEKTEDKLNLYQSLDINGESKEPTPSQAHIKGIFSDEGYLNFQKKIRALLFHRYHKTGLIPSGIISICLVAFTFLFIWPYGGDIYGTHAPILYEITFIMNGIFLFAIFLFAGSLAGIILSILIATHQIQDDYLEISNFVKILKDNKKPVPNDLMGYHSFRTRLMTIGDYLYGIAWKILAIFIANIAYWLFGVWLLENPWIPERVLIGVVFSGVALLFAYVSQRGLHSLLTRWRNEILVVLMERRTYIDLALVKPLWTKGIPRLENSQEHLIAHELLDKVVKDIESSSTWVFPSNRMNVIIVSLSPLLLSILSVVVKYYIP